ncbi:acyl-CoA dehydrogenase family protein [Natronomonas sp. EA1]|uniref:acyl-CoA dehydrogenase family protein n=1 Tax=Natronomonas sp. EA1 TaxID=3421655 RepID=UPI003EBB09FA
MSDPIDYGQYEAGRECNYWALDPTLQAAVRHAYTDEEFAWAESVLSEFGHVAGHTLADTSNRIDRHGPILHTYDKEGNIRNEVEYHPDQHENERIVYGEFGFTHDAFHAPPGRDEPASLTHVLALQTLLCYTDVGFCCPVSMTTGAALVLEKFDDGSLSQYFDRLTSRDVDEHIEGAMFLTEQQGGSDVGANEVRAEPQEDGTYQLYGEKWFCSNLDAEGALALARTPDAPAGTRGLSLFLVPRTKPSGEVNDSLFRRLKDKLGTLSVPTGEIEFRGAEAYLVGEEGRGFKQMAEMMNYERLTNATGALGIMGRGLLEAKVHAANREAFGSTIQEYPLLRRDLAELTTDYEAAAAFAFEAARLMDAREEAGDDSSEYKLMRLLVPIAKYKTARMSVETASYCMEVLGGNGYVREHVTPRLLRDAQVLPIWEGTSNILSLDVLRVFARESAHEALIPYVDDLLDVDHPALAEPRSQLREAFTELQTALGTLATVDEDHAQYHAKQLADLVFDVVAGALLLDRAADELDDDGRLALVVTLFARDRFEGGYGIDSGERLGDEQFDAIVRYGSVEPESLAASPSPDD